MFILFVTVMIYCLGVVLPAEDTKTDRRYSWPTMIGPIVDKNMRSLSLENLTNDSSWENKHFDLFLMSVPGLYPFVVLRETEDETTDRNGNGKETFKAEEEKSQIDMNKIPYFSKSYHIGRIQLKQVEAFRALIAQTKQK